MAGGVLLAAVVVVDPGGWYPFGPAKQGAVFVAALLAISAAAGRPGRLPRAVAWLWGALLAWLAVAAVLGADPLYAWVGTPERRLGWLTWALLGGCAWAGARLGDGVRRFSRGAVLAGLWCGGYCLVELWWRAPVGTTSVTSRLGGPFGSAAYLGAALCLLLPLALGVAADSGERRAWRVAAGVALATGTVALVGSGTRAAWIACGAVAVTVLAVRRPAWRTTGAVAGVAVVAVLVVVPRLDQVAARDGAGGASRLDEWRVAARVIGRHPVVGAGPEGYRIVFADGVDARYERDHGREVLPDRAHSGPLDVAAIGGIPAGVAYVALLALVARRAVGGLRRGDALRAGLAGAALAYLIQQLALFPLAELDPAFWLIAGALFGSHDVAGRSKSERQRPDRDAAEPVASRPAGSPHGAWRLLGDLGRWGPAALAVAVFGTSVVGVAADRVAREALRERPGSPAARAAAERAAQLRPDVVRYHLLVASVENDRQSVAGARAAVAAGERASDVSPGDPIVRQALAWARTSLAQVTGGPADRAAAIADWERLVADDEHCGPCWHGLGVARLLADDTGGADDAFARATELGQVAP